MTITFSEPFKQKLFQVLVSNEIGLDRLSLAYVLSPPVKEGSGWTYGYFQFDMARGKLIDRAGEESGRAGKGGRQVSNGSGCID